MGGVVRQKFTRQTHAVNAYKLCKQGGVMGSRLLKRAIQASLGLFIFVVVFAQLAGWAVTEKAWLERLWISVFTGGSFGLLGAGLGLIIGGIGFALGGGAFGVAGWLVFGVLGFGAGALGGSLWTILSNPQNYDFDYFRLTLIIVVASVVALVGILTVSKIERTIQTYIKNRIEAE